MAKNTRESPQAGIQTRETASNLPPSSLDSDRDVPQITVPAQTPKTKKNGRPKGSKNSRDVTTRARIAKFLQLRVESRSQKEIKAITGMSTGAISALDNMFKPLLEHIKNVQGYRVQRADILDAAHMMAIQSLSNPQKHADASLNQAAYAAEVLYKMSRLEQNKSTSNSSVAYYSPNDDKED